MTIAGANTVILTVAATLCGLFTVLALSVRQIRKEAHGALLRTLRLFGFSIGYLVIGVVYIPVFYVMLQRLSERRSPFSNEPLHAPQFVQRPARGPDERY